MNWSNLFNFNKKCQHPNVDLSEEIAYCPDCGELIEVHWYMVRCATCGVKEKTAFINGEVIPNDNFCHNCGSRDFVVEKLNKIDCVNINYAIGVKEVFDNFAPEYCQSWVEKVSSPKLIKG